MQEQWQTNRTMLPRMAVSVAVFLLMGAWMLWGRHADSPGAMQARVVEVWGVKGTQPGELNRPRALLAADDGTIYVIDRSGRMQHFSREGKYLAHWRFPQWQNGTPTSVSADAQGRLIVANTHYSTILVYGHGGRLEWQFGKRGDEEGDMFMPTDAITAPDGTFYVLERESWKDKVMMYSPEGKFVGEWGTSGDGAGQFVRPMAIEMDRKGRIWVADSCNHRLEAFDREGKHLYSIGEFGSGSGQLNYPYDLALGPNGELVVAEYGNNRVQILRDDGTSVGIIGGPGKDPGQFGSPWGVDVGPDGTIWVADTLNDRIQGLKVDWEG